MQKEIAMILVFLCVPGQIITFALQQNLAFVAFTIAAFLFGSIYIHKYQRDETIIAQARLERQSTSNTRNIASKGSRGLFVPKPLSND